MRPLLILLLCAVVLGQQKEGTEATEEQTEGLPDFGDKKVNKRLRCSACKCVVAEVKGALDAVSKLRHGKPKAYELEDKLDNLCRVMRDNYGLLRKNNKPTEIFSKNSAISRLQGNWINSYLETRCGEILSEYEDELLSSYSESLIDLTDLICRQGDSTCTEEQIQTEDP
eukprot:TRINITY_DN429_c5_g2_i1.p1 TRINITY_DN429_c5_g2~~TRINITY_DN429_c5_g2_i1.p1  ORF type:complete len:170 (+),score=35.24 TRINITY_DN429_c5_g2_i1:83-592(+)